MKTFSSRANSSRIAWLSASRIVIVAMVRLTVSVPGWIDRVRVDVCIELFGFRKRTFFSETKRVFHFFPHFFVDSRECFLVDHFLFEQTRREKLDRIAFL